MKNRTHQRIFFNSIEKIVFVVFWVGGGTDTFHWGGLNHKVKSATYADTISRLEP